MNPGHQRSILFFNRRIVVHPRIEIHKRIRENSVYLQCHIQTKNYHVMAKMIVNHKVVDFPKWKSVYDSMHGLRKQFGCTAEAVYQGNHNPNELVIITHWGSKEQAQKYGQSQELKEGMQQAGVAGPPSIDFVD